jgi:hypothetical protein
MPEFDHLVRERFGRLAGEELPIPSAEAVHDRGRQRRRRARGHAVVIVAVATAVTAIAASQLAASPAARRPAPVSRGHHASATRALGCPASTSLAADLRSELPLSAQRGARPIALSARGNALYVMTTTAGFHGIAEESLETGRVLREIQPLPRNYLSAAGGLGPAGTLVWSSTYSTHGGESGAMSPVQMWSPRTGQVVALEPAGQHGAVLSPPVFPSPGGSNLAAWEVADGSKQEIVEANLATGVAEPVGRGYLGPPVFVKDALVFAAASRPSGTQTHLVAVDTATFPASQRLAVPVSLRGFSEPAVYGYGRTGPWAPPPGLIATYGAAVVYVSTGLTRLYYSPSPSQAARLLYTLTGGNEVSPNSLEIGLGYIGWGTDAASSYLVSTLSYAVTEVINGSTVWGTLYGVGNDVVVSMSPPTKKAHLMRDYLVRGWTVAGLRCA